MENHSKAPLIANAEPGIPTSLPGGKSFIGGKSSHFGGSSPTPTSAPQNAVLDDDVSSSPEPKQESEKNEQDKVSLTCHVCGSDVLDWHAYCPSCGADRGSGDVSKALGLELNEEDLSQYLFKGYLVKEIEIIKGHTVLFKTLLPVEVSEAEEKLVNIFRDKTPTDAQWVNTNAQISLSYGWIKFDGTSLGKTPDERYEHIGKSIGVHLMDAASKKWNLFNRAISNLLADPDAIKN